MAASAAVKVVLLDIEGTVCPISFVKDILFPYALKALAETVKTQWDSPNFVKYRDAFPPEYSSSKEALESHVRDLVERDVKISYLKSLQGYLWEEGYKSGDLKAPLFPDVPAKLSAWHEKGLKVMIYSSGSVPAQKLLFGHTDAEPSDLKPLISDWFDTVNAGLKTEPSSYEAIARCHADIPIQEWLFLSDNVKEVDAAKAAGMQSLVVQRPGNAALSDEVLARLPVIETLDSLDDDFTIKKQLAGQKRQRSTEPSPAKDAEEDAEEDAEVPDPKKPRQAPEIPANEVNGRHPNENNGDAVSGTKNLEGFRAPQGATASVDVDAPQPDTDEATVTNQAHQ
ncbi:HAD-like domain-containing protein [Biscogniauxia mediterranea]|nr:HAD-like domain-containing protein [Biscogniauxia mediterranea]